MHIGDHLTEPLLRCDATHVFGIPGRQTSALVDVIRKRERALRHVVMCDECNVTFAADAFVRLTHREGICDVTVGPGCGHKVHHSGPSPNPGLPSARFPVSRE
jgi:acetolactate synthase-1/2/3 large subunit